MSAEEAKYWRLKDYYENVELDQIDKVSCRARSLLCRNMSHAAIESNILNITGAIEMMSGMDYHFDNYMRYQSKLHDEEHDPEIHNSLLHEVTAYLNRLGQFYYFSQSKFVKNLNINSVAILPKLNEKILLRHKASAHRSIDAPKKEDDAGWLPYHAMTFSNMGGYVKDHCGNFVFTISKSSEARVSLNLTIEHSSIIGEAYSLLQSVLSE